MTKCQNPNPSSQIWIVQDLTEIQGDDSEKKFSGAAQTPYGLQTRESDLGCSGDVLKWFEISKSQFI